MLTGRNHTTIGMACTCEATTGFPGSNGHIPFETATIAEVLGARADEGNRTPVFSLGISPEQAAGQVKFRETPAQT